MAHRPSPLATLTSSIAAAAAALVLALSWLPDSKLSPLPMLPAWIDAGGTMATLRTGIAMALATAFILGARPRASLTSNMLLALLLLALAEGGQLLIPTRGASLGDLAWGTAGVLLAGAVTAALRRRTTLKRPRS